MWCKANYLTICLLLLRWKFLERTISGQIWDPRLTILWWCLVEWLRYMLLQVWEIGTASTPIYIANFKYTHKHYLNNNQTSGSFPAMLCLLPSKSRFLPSSTSITTNLKHLILSIIITYKILEKGASNFNSFPFGVHSKCLSFFWFLPAS